MLLHLTATLAQILKKEDIIFFYKKIKKSYKKLIKSDFYKDKNRKYSLVTLFTEQKRIQNFYNKVSFSSLATTEGSTSFRFRISINSSPEMVSFS